MMMQHGETLRVSESGVVKMFAWNFSVQPHTKGAPTDNASLVHCTLPRFTGGTCD